MIIFPEAKPNLGLHILGKRADGYHEIETLFLPYPDLRDELEIVPSESGCDSFELSGGDWPKEKDLSFKALQILRQTLKFQAVAIRLKKNIPSGAGLGGGSSDAASTLKGINEVFSLNIPESKLCEYAAALGSDCPFFIHGRPMIGRGRGEILSDFHLDLSAFRIELRLPEAVKVSTAEAYSQVAAQGYKTGRVSLEEILSLPIEMWRSELLNDFEPSVFANHPAVEREKQRLYDEGAVYASMSGSGSAVFGLFRR